MLQVHGESSGGELAAVAEASTGVSMSAGCVIGSTAMDAFRVAIGSTLGAFIALGVVVGFVLLAKCQAHHGHHVTGYGARGRRRLASTESDEVSLNEDDIIDFEDDFDGQLPHIVFSPPPGSSLILPVGEKMPAVGRKAFLVSPVGDQMTSPSDCRSIALTTGEIYPFSSSTASDGTTVLTVMTSPLTETDDASNQVQFSSTSLPLFLDDAHSNSSPTTPFRQHFRSAKQSEIYSVSSVDETREVQIENNVDILASGASETPVQQAFKLILVSDSGETVFDVVDGRSGISRQIYEHEDGRNKTTDVIRPQVLSSASSSTSNSTSGCYSSEGTGQLATASKTANMLSSLMIGLNQGEVTRTGNSQQQLNGDIWCQRLMDQFIPSPLMSNLGHSVPNMSASHDSQEGFVISLCPPAAATGNTNATTATGRVVVDDDVSIGLSPASFRSRPRPTGRLANISGRLSPDPSILVGGPQQLQQPQLQLQPHQSVGGGLRQNNSSVW